MAGSPRFKIYNASGEYLGCMKHPEDAAVIVSVLGDGAMIRDGHRKKDIAWEEGVHGKAGDSYGEVAIHVWSFVDDRNKTHYDRIYGEGAAERTRKEQNDGTIRR